MRPENPKVAQFFVAKVASFAIVTTMTTAMRNANERASSSQAARHSAEAVTEGNREKLALLKRVLDRQLALAVSRGFHGSMTIELAVQDGTIQHVLHRVEQLEK